MATIRKVPLVGIENVHFSATDVLTNEADRFERKHILTSAMAQTNSDHEDIHLIVKLENGELVDISTNLLDVGEGFVELRGGYFIPIRAILSVDL